ncbi:hypothetical protein [Paraflavitalea speifideaquila]|uniref:hypothetical protein n=1 Tax=Paraflavitalea speifideaquila TaxID=3076558 RepID=UPI0028EAFDE4|nr:hypothetical protein [Paraflavitalea speifideiaquila]
MKIRDGILVMLLIVMAQSAFAHALWIETAANGKKGQSHTIKIFYGEYADQERDSVARWYSNIRELHCWLITPDGNRKELNYTKDIDFLQAQFIPEQEGSYIISITHDAKDFPGETRYQFNTSAAIRIGKTEAASFAGNDMHVAAIPSTNAKSAIQIKAYIKGKPAAKMQVEVVSADGWKSPSPPMKMVSALLHPPGKDAMLLRLPKPKKHPAILRARISSPSGDVLPPASIGIKPSCKLYRKVRADAFLFRCLITYRLCLKTKNCPQRKRHLRVASFIEFRPGYIYGWD